MIGKNFHADKDILIKRMTTFVSIITCILIFLGTFFTLYMMKVEEKSCKEYLEGVVKQTASNIKGRVNNDIHMLAILSGKLSTSITTFTKKDVTKFLIEHVKSEEFHLLSFTYENGTNIRVRDNVGLVASSDIASSPCFAVAMDGSPCFAETIPEPLSKSGFVNRYFVPVYNKNNEVVAVLGSNIDSNIFRTIIDYSDFNNKGSTHVIDENGNFLIKSENEKNISTNVFHKKNEYINTSKEEILKKLQEQTTGSFSYKAPNGVTYFAAYSPIANNHSYVITIVPKDVVMLHFNYILTALMIIVLSIGLLLLLLLRYTKKLYKDNETAIFQIAFTDEVTESSNRTKFLLDAREILQEYPDDNFAMISMDITKFKVINELFGYKKANEILKDVYSIIRKNLTKNSICARDFAATFVILYKYDKKEFIIKYFIEKVVAEIEKYNDEVMAKTSSNHDIRVFAKLASCFGIYLINDKSLSINLMCDRASIAKRNVKGDVLNIYQFYDDGLKAQILQDKAIEDEMYSALENNQFKMHLQPKFNLQTLELEGAEALVRWMHPIKGIVPPMNFIPIFEKNGFIIELDKCIWRQACEFLAERKEQNLTLFPISVNVSRLHLNNEAFIENLINLIRAYEIEPEFLELELTETACLDNPELFENIMNKLKEYGFKISMDDFGTGYSSLNMLKQLPVDVLKLDRGFITDSIGNYKGEVVIKNILKMAEELNIETVGEGVETTEQALFLKNNGCKIAQGFLYGRPMSPEHFIRMFLDDSKIKQD